MNTNETIRAVKILASLFSAPLSQEQSAFLREQFAPMSFEAVEKAVKAHRSSHEFINFPQLVEGCKAAMREGLAVTVSGSREGSAADVYRRQNPQWASIGDWEMILRVCRSWWYRASREKDGVRVGSDGYRRQIGQTCRNKLIVAGMPAEIVDPWVVTVFEPDAGHFQRCLEDLRESEPAAAVA